MQITTIPKKGDIGPDVCALQERLLANGHGEHAVDGIFGEKTADALASFQAFHGLPSGPLGPNTLNLLGLDLVASRGSSPYVALTQPLEGRKGRHLHPELRMRLERAIFTSRNIPKCFLAKSLQSCVVEVAKGFESLKIKESGGNNRGHDVGLVQSVIGGFIEGGTGDPWCMSVDQCIIAFIEDYFQQASPVSASESCTFVASEAKKVEGLLSSEPERGTLWIARHGEGPAGHTGTVISADGSTMNTFEGNTGDGSIRDGDGAYFRSRNVGINGTLDTIGFVRIYPFNKVPGGKDVCTPA